MSDKFRVFPVFLWALVGCLLLGWASPEKLEVLGWKLTMALTSGYIGYWLDRSLFPGARPVLFELAGEPERADFARFRRALLVGLLILGVCLAL